MEFINSREHIFNVVGDLSNLPTIKHVKYKYADGKLSRGRRVGRGYWCSIKLKNGYEVRHFSSSGFGCAREDAEMKCLKELHTIDIYLKYKKGNK